MSRLSLLVLVALIGFVGGSPDALANPLERELGRAEVRVFSAKYPLLLAVEESLNVENSFLVQRLELLNYGRVRGKRPDRPGQFFWGNERFWIFRRGFLDQGRWREAQLLEVSLGSGGQLVAVRTEGGDPVSEFDAVLEPVLLAETLRAGRAPRIPIDLDQLPDHVWQAVVASEDARFFDHGGVDSRSVARALLANIKKRGVAQGGSTITQQLIKLRELTPKQTLGRKVSEAVRALALEAEVAKRDILESYLHTVYFGHIDGVEVYGLGAAARAFFSTTARDLSLAQAALLAGMIQSPNRLSPVRNPDAAVERRQYVLDRLVDVGWASEATANGIARRSAPSLRLSRPEPMASGDLLAAIRDELGTRVRTRQEQGRGLIVETNLDPWIQSVARKELQLSARRANQRGPTVEGAFVLGNARTGAILAYVGSAQDSRRSELDRARRAQRQPGSTVKPLVVLEALERCGAKERLTLASQVADEPLTLELPSGPWTPRNSDRRERGVVDVRRTVTESLNLPTVRLARHCGFAAVAERFQQLGVASVTPEQPAFVLGSVEMAPKQLLEVYSRLAVPARVRTPSHLVARASTPSGNVLVDSRDRRRRLRHVPKPEARYLIREALGDAASAAGVTRADAWGKTGTSSNRRDAWFAGGSGDLVAVVWLGRDDGGAAGLSGARHAAPVFAGVLERAIGPVQLQAKQEAEQARQRLVSRTIDGETGLVLRAPREGSRSEWFLRGTVPAKKRWWRPGASARVIQ